VSNASRDVSSSAANTPGQFLRETTAATRVDFLWFGVRKSLASDVKSLDHEQLGVQRKFLHTGKERIDSRQLLIREITVIRTAIASSWRNSSVPFPERGVRLVRRDRIDAFIEMMTDHRKELADVVAELNAHYVELKSAERLRAGGLRSSGEHTDSLLGCFEVEWDFPSLEPPNYLSPILFERERARVEAQFDESARMVEKMFLTDFFRLVAGLTDGISPVRDEGKVFCEMAIRKLAAFSERFDALKVKRNPELEHLIAEAQRIVHGGDAQGKGDESELYREIAVHLGTLRSSINAMKESPPKRRVVWISNP
jgi:hypothetical protein